MVNNNISWMKLYYSLLDWEWIKCPEMVCVWIKLLLRAAPKAKRLKGVMLRRGYTERLSRVHIIELTK